jgi:O-antigen ligase
VVVLSIGGLLLPILLVPHLAERLLLLGGSLSASEAEANAALAFRPELWKASWALFTENWINGVGLRGASGAMYSILAASDFFPDAMLSRTWHPHLGILEIATDTGLLGVLGYLIFLIMVVRWMLVANTAGQGGATTFLCIALLAMFPLSSALSMYSFPSGSITWPALALALGAHFKETR